MKQLEELPMECKAAGGHDDPDGIYHVPHYRIKDYIFWIVFSTGEGWEHLSVSLKRIVSHRRKVVAEAKRCPTWEEMCMVKDLFWEQEEVAIQYHPPKSHYVNNHKWCLHIWRPSATALPIPDNILVGIKDELPVTEKLNIDEGEK